LSPRLPKRATHALWMLPQLRHIQAKGFKNMVPSGVEAAAKEIVAHAQAGGKVEYDVVVGPRLSPWRHHALAQLDQLLGRGAYLEADTQPLSLPWRVDRQHNVRVVRRRGLEQIAMHMEAQL